LLAAFVSVVAGAAGLQAVFLVVFAGPSYEPEWGRVAGYSLVVVAALIVGRRAKPKTPPPPLPAGPPIERGADSGVPARRRFEENAVPIAVTAVALALSGVFFPLGYFFWLVGWEGGNAHGGFLGFGLAAVGPVLIAGAWVLRR
jgi:hypothetical protein